jgi:hypothetical protein
MGRATDELVAADALAEFWGLPTISSRTEG